MCKVAAVSKITPENREDVWTFMMLLAQLISQGNNDGLGYASLDGEGKLFGEKWLVNETAFQDLSAIKNVTSENITKIYDCFGKVNRDDARAIILHTRAATCTKAIQNTHPFVDDKDNPTVATLHNGIINNHMQFVKKYSSCDSEVLAHLYFGNKVLNDLGNLNNFIKQIRGWYTVLNLGVRPDGTPVMDAYSDSGYLGSYFIKEFGTRIWSSSGRDIWEVAKALGLTAIDHKALKAGTAMRISVETGEIIAGLRLAQGYEPVRVVPSPRGNIQIMEGNLDDESFRAKYFKGLLKEEPVAEDTQVDPWGTWGM